MKENDGSDGLMGCSVVGRFLIMTRDRSQIDILEPMSVVMVYAAFSVGYGRVHRFC
jgi:hypothetical protein